MSSISDVPVLASGILEPMSEAGTGGDVPTICLIGPTGTGKSSTGNTFFKWQSDDAEGRFAVSADMTSMTTETIVKSHPWRGTEQVVRCVDTPGLCDTGGRDEEHVASMVDILRKEVKYVNVFLILFNGHDAKLSSHLKDMLIVFRDTFGQEFLKHVMLGFTHWEYTKIAKLRRKKSKSTNDEKAKMMNRELQATLGHDFDCPCVFLDNQLNEFDDEELKELGMGAELDSVMSEFLCELDNVFAFLRTTLPFYCRDIEAAFADKAALRSSVAAWLKIGFAVANETLGRRLILAEQDVIGKGWIRYRRRWVYGVLRRQHLRFFVDDSCESPAAPEHVDLTGCVCHDGRRAKIRGLWFFCLYRPWTQGSEADRALEFSVSTESERKRWVLLIGEATQISESCHRIQRFYENLRAAKTEPEYVGTISMVGSNTMVIPVEWVRHNTVSDLSRAYEPPTLEQAGKDLARDVVKVEGHVFSKPRTDDLSIAVARHILRKVNREGRKDSEELDAKAIVMARDVILSCSRSDGGGDTLEALRLLFGTDLVHIVPVSLDAEPVSVRVLHAGDAEDTASPRQGGPNYTSTGLPQFEYDASALKLDMHKVRKMELEGEQAWSKVNAVDRSSWVPDDQMPQCMRCGVQFNTWRLRRHHCRACGCLVCLHCSRHFVPIATGEAITKAGDIAAGSEGSRAITKAGDIAAGSEAEPLFPRQRVCFLCYQRAVFEDLDQRKETGATPKEGDESCDTSLAEIPRQASEESCGSKDSLPARREPSFISEDDVMLLPTISVEMGSRYKICSQDPVTEDSVLFFLDCRYVRVIRWSGLADSGRIFISIDKKK